MVIVIITFACKYILDWYLETKAGMLLRAVGDNDKIITSLSVDKGKVKIIGLAIANGLVSLSGCIFAQEQRFFDVSMGTGTMVIGLASVIIGTSLFRSDYFPSGDNQCRDWFCDLQSLRGPGHQPGLCLHRSQIYYRSPVPDYSGSGNGAKEEGE